MTGDYLAEEPFCIYEPRRAVETGLKSPSPCQPVEGTLADMCLPQVSACRPRPANGLGEHRGAQHSR